MISTCGYSIRRTKENIFFCIVVSEEVSNMVDFEGFIVLIGTESGGIFFVF